MILLLLQPWNLKSLFGASSLTWRFPPVKNVTHIHVVGEDEYVSDEEEATIICTINAMPTEAFLSPKGKGCL